MVSCRTKAHEAKRANFSERRGQAEAPVLEMSCHEACSGERVAARLLSCDTAPKCSVADMRKTPMREEV